MFFTCDMIRFICECTKYRYVFSNQELYIDEICLCNVK